MMEIKQEKEVVNYLGRLDFYLGLVLSVKSTNVLDKDHM